MHYHTEVWIPRAEDYVKAVEFFMAPWNTDTDHPRPGAFWDYYLIGGGWSGVHEGADEDETLRDFRRYGRPSDVMNVLELRDSLTCHTMVLPERAPLRVEKLVSRPRPHFVKTAFNGNVVQALDKVGIREGYMVTLDCHN